MLTMKDTKEQKVKHARIWAARLVLILFGLAILPGPARPVKGQAGGEIVEARAEHRFGEEIRFFARIQSTSPVQNASVTFRPENGMAQTQAMSVNADGTAEYRYDAHSNALPPFARIVYSFDVTLADGTRFASADYDFIYADNRFEWIGLEGDGLRVHWYEGDAAFGAAALDAARRGVASARALLSLELLSPIDIYIYAKGSDLQSALELGGRAWMAGHANPERNLAMITIAPGQEYEFERQVPHELTHVLLYQALGAGYYNLPVWLREGAALNAELYPDPDYEAALTAAVESNSLIPLSELCASFPPDSARAFLAYAQSRSFTRFLFDHFGVTGVSALVSAYADGMDCEQGARRALEQPLSQLETRWRGTALGENRSGAAAANLLPYFLVLALALFVPVWGAIGRMIGRAKNDQ